MVPRQGAQVQILVRELDPTCHNLKIPHTTAKIKGAATKTQHSHISKYFFKHANGMNCIGLRWLCPRLNAKKGKETLEGIRRHNR